MRCLLVFVLLTSACALEPAPIIVQVTTRAPDGSVETHEALHAEVMEPVRAGLPPFVADGETVRDAARIWDAQRIELARPESDTPVTVLRQGAALAAADMRIVPTPAFDGFAVEAGGSAITVELRGVVDPVERRQVLGYLAAGFLGADTVRPGSNRDFGASAVAVVAIATIGYIGCITGGQELCGENAANLCGAGQVDEYKMICGAGYDLDDNFQLGFQCSFRCKP